MSSKSVNTLYDGVTPAPHRDLVAQMVLLKDYEKVVIPGIGRFGAAECIIKHGYPSDRLHGCDITLFSSIIGHLADPRHTLEELNIQLPDNLLPFLDDVQNDYDRGAAAMMGIGYLQIKPIHQMAMNIRKELMSNRIEHRQHIADKLQVLAESLQGVHYDAIDMWELIEPFKDDPNAYIQLDHPCYSGGYEKMFAGQGESITWNDPKLDQIDPADLPMMLDRFKDYKCDITIEVVTRHLGYLTEGWVPYCGMHVGKEQAYYLVSNFNSPIRHGERRIREAPVKHYPVYNDEEITADSVINIFPVDDATGMYYRNLFVHRKPPTKARETYLMAIDGRVMASIGFNDQHLMLGNKRNTNMIFGICIGSKRYPRLSRLVDLCLASGSMRDVMCARNRYLFRIPDGITTCTISKDADRSTEHTWDLVKREKYPDGRGLWKSVYQRNFQDDTWADCLKMWFEKHTVKIAPPEPKKKRQMAEKTPWKGLVAANG